MEPGISQNARNTNAGTDRHRQVRTSESPVSTTRMEENLGLVGRPVDRHGRILQAETCALLFTLMIGVKSSLECEDGEVGAVTPPSPVLSRPASRY